VSLAIAVELEREQKPSWRWDEGCRKRPGSVIAKQHENPLNTNGEGYFERGVRLEGGNGGRLANAKDINSHTGEGGTLPEKGLRGNRRGKKPGILRMISVADTVGARRSRAFYRDGGGKLKREEGRYTGCPDRPVNRDLLNQASGAATGVW